LRPLMLSKLQIHLHNNLPFLIKRKLLLAVSGGLDSMVLVHQFKELGYDISIAHCNFNLRDEESDADEQFVRKYAEDNNIKLFVTNFNTRLFAEDTKQSIQISARQLRYSWFAELLQQNDLDFLLTAHHLDDSIETFLINFTRGTGLEGLTGIPEINDKIVRPLLPFTREEIETYAKSNDITWREDSSNASNKYLRNKLRHDVVPVLKELNPSFADSFAQTLVNLQQAQSMVQDAAILIYKQVVTQKHNQKHFDLLQLKRLPNYRAYLYQWLRPFGLSAWEDIYNLINAQSGKFVVAHGYRLLKDRDYLILEPLPTLNELVYAIREGQSEVNHPIQLKLSQVAAVKEISKNNSIFVDNHLINYPLFLRKWQEGDYFYPFGMNGQKKKVSKYFKDEKFSLSDKENTWLLCFENQVIWVVGHRADNRYKVTENTTQILKIEVL
jgi:tRNA(Ile)-lysidine synthase